MKNNKTTGFRPRWGFLPVAVCSLAVALAAALATPRASAAGVLAFDDVTLFGGLISYGGADGVDPLVGTDIIFDKSIGIGTPLPGSLTLVGGKLNFVTGPNI